MGVVKAVCLSKEKGTAKTAVEAADFIADHGLAGDAHAGRWHRQVSLLSYEKIEAFRSRGAQVTAGAFGENLVVAGYDFSQMVPGTQFQCNEVILELTQIGKECHHGCHIFQQMGECIMPSQGVFCRVLHGGRISKGDAFVVISE